MPIYIGVNGTARELKSKYIGVGNAARQLKSQYVGVGNVARQVFGGERNWKSLYFIDSSGKKYGQGYDTLDSETDSDSLIELTSVNPEGITFLPNDEITLSVSLCAGAEGISEVSFESSILTGMISMNYNDYLQNYYTTGYIKNNLTGTNIVSVDENIAADYYNLKGTLKVEKNIAIPSSITYKVTSESSDGAYAELYFAVKDGATANTYILL